MKISLSVLPIYNDINDQMRFNEVCKVCHNYNFITPKWLFPSFAFTRERFYGLIDSFEVYHEDGTWFCNVKKSLLQIKTDVENSIDYLIFRGLTPISGNSGEIIREWPCGCYYYKIVSEDHVYYSEIFCVETNDAIVYERNHVLEGDFLQDFTNWQTYASTADWTSLENGFAAYGGGATNLVVLQQTTLGVGSYITAITFTVNSSGSVFLAISVNNTSAEIFLVTAPGTYTIYSRSPTQFKVTNVDGTAFEIGNISIRKIIGMKEHVGLRVQNTCRGINVGSLDSEYNDKIWLDAKVLQPQYGEDIKQDENGDFEKIDSFVRAYKQYDISPLPLPEFLIDALAKLNTYDYVSINNGVDERFFIYGLEPGLKNTITISNIKLKNEWDELGCYGMVNLSFEESMAIKRSCCDSVNIVSCEEIIETPVITYSIPSPDYPREFQITAYNPLPNHCWVRLFIATAAHDPGSLFLCDLIPPEDYLDSGVVIRSEDFNNNGLLYEYQLVGGQPTDVCVYIIVFQPGCSGQKTSNKLFVEAG